MSDLKPYSEKQLSDDPQVDESGSESGRNSDVAQPSSARVPVKWYRSTYYNAIILGLCNFCAPGIWVSVSLPHFNLTKSVVNDNVPQGAMNSLGGGGEESPWLVDAANALTFCLMVLTCALSGIFVKYLGIRWYVQNLLSFV